MKQYKELWDYFTLVKTSELVSSRGRTHSGQIMFKKPFQGAWVQFFLLSVVYLIVKIRHYFTDKGEFKFTVNYIIDTGSENSEPLTSTDLEYFKLNNRHPRLMQLTIGASIYGENWYSDLKKQLSDMAERYQDTSIYGIGIYLYAAANPDYPNASDMEPKALMNSVWEIVKEQPRKDIDQETAILGLKEEELRERAVDLKDKAKSTLGHHQSKCENLDFVDSKRTGRYINPSKPDKNTKGFIVGDIETILVNDIHVPYAIGYVYAGERSLSILDINKPFTYCTENLYYSGDFKERSLLMFDDFLKGLISYSNNCGTKKVYFHNLSRFDGILLLKLLLEDRYEGKWLLKPIIREHNVYQVLVYEKISPKIPVLDIRDSLKLLPGSLKSLAETMCPELGCKGYILHEELNEFNISERKIELIKYMEQDILILAGVLRKAQEKYWNRFSIDITNCLTVSSMAMKIYRTHYYPSTYPFYRPQPNQAAFIRRGYYGGHTDVYIPYGKELFYYDVNSLYPYAMTKAMPGGKPVWHGNLKGCDLEPLFGFVEAKVTCPDSIEVPLLPYKDPKTGTLLFPTGIFTGVYFTEELKLALKVGYKIELKHGYLFDKMESPFSEFVREIYEERLEAKKRGDQVISSLHKLTMNSLYGRFGIKPECNITEICDKDRLDDLMSIYQFSEVEPVNGTYYIVSYTGMLQRMKGHPEKAKADSLLHRNHMLNNNSTSAVQMSAAITAYARIHMYKYISLPGCHYTDTDSVALDKPLPDSEVSSYSLGKLKLEHKVVEGYFLAPKCYALVLDESKNIIRNKGLARNKVDLSWFIEQYKNMGRVIKCTVESNFKINWSKLNIYRASIMLNLGIDPSTKRNLVIDENNRWVATLPLKISDSSVTRQEKPKSQIGLQPAITQSPAQLPAIPLLPSLQPTITQSPSLQPAIPQSESMPAMPQSSSKPYHESNQSDVAGIELLKEQRSALTKLEEQLRIERSERKMLEEQLRVERSAREVLEEQCRVERKRLEEQLRVEREMLRVEREGFKEQLRVEREMFFERFRALEQNLSSSALKEDQGNEATSFSDRSKTATSFSDRSKTMDSHPTEQRTQGEIDSTSEILQRNGDVDFGSKPRSKPSNRYDDNKGKKGDGKKEGDLKHHPLPREPP